MQRKNTVRILENETRGISVPVRLISKTIETSRRPGLSAAARAILSETRRIMSLHSMDEQRAYKTDSALNELVDQAARTLGFDLAPFERNELLSQIEKESSPFGILQSLIDNPEVSDIIVHDFAKIVVQCGRSTVKTDLEFSDQKTYETFVERLLQNAGTSYSTKKPIADGMIGTLARIHVVHRCLCESGPYLTIRVNRMVRVGIDDLIENGMAPDGVFSYLRKLVRSGMTVFVVGEVGTGKTTLVRALATAIPKEESILVIEDTPEIQLEHPHVRCLTTRETNSEGVGRIAPSECIRAGMRMAMNRIIFGEIRDAEAAEAFIDVCASGHPGVSTIHARSASEAITRLELFLGRAQRGVVRQVAAEQIVTAIQVIVFVSICPATKRRRIVEVKEIGPVADGTIRQREIFRYQFCDDEPQWRVVTRTSAYRDLLESDSHPVVLSSYPALLTECYSRPFGEYGRSARGDINEK